MVVTLLFLGVVPLLGSGAYSDKSGSNISSSASAQMYPAPLSYAAGPANSPTCSTTALCPDALANAYEFTSLIKSGTDGKGQTIVIVDACGDPNLTSDLTGFDAEFNLPNPVLDINYFEGLPTNQKCISAWSGEVALDVEWSHVVAPRAKIDLLVTINPGAYEMYAAWTYALRNNLGNQITNSWGGSGCNIVGCNNTIGEGIGPCTLTNGTQGVNVPKILRQAAAQRVSVLVASGDSGAYGLGTKQEESVPSDCNGVLVVGGTRLNVTSSGKYLGEVGWKDSGGGYMTAPKEPSYEKIAKINDSYGTLAIPTVSADASCGSPVWTLIEGGWYLICGTSLASPLWAGFMADVNQIRAGNNLSPAGFVNPFLYTVVYINSNLYKKDFHDITQGNNGWPAGPGWDAVTGLGSFNAPNLAETLGDAKGA